MYLQRIGVPGGIFGHLIARNFPWQWGPDEVCACRFR